MHNDRTKYFAADEAEYLIPFLQNRSKTWFDSLAQINYLDKLRRSWLAYYGVYYDDSHAITYGGETGELVNFPVNHYRNIATHILNMVTSTRPAFQAKAINTDSKSSIQVTLANGLLEYYMRQARLEDYLKKATEFAVVMGSGYIKMDWNATAGDIYDYIEPEYETKINEQTGEEELVLDENGEPVAKSEGYPIREGDVEFTVLSPFDVVFDSTKEDGKHDWQLCRSFKNKFDLAAKYPEFQESIVALKTKSDIQKSRITLSPYDETVDVPVYEFYHRPSEALPKGRYVIYLSEDVVLYDGILPYRNLPIFRISFSDILGTPYGYTPLFDLLPVQDMVNSLYSTIATNQTAFGIQLVGAERDSGITPSQLTSGLTLLEINPGSKMPEPINLTRTPAEIFNFVQSLEKVMETLSGISSVVRGNPEASLRTGNALALVLSQSVQFASGLQQQYIKLIEDVGTNLIRLLQDFAEVPRIAHISGLSSASYMREFTRENISSINRVIVDAGNALASTPAGRLEIATQLINMGLIKSPEQFMSVLTTGKLENLTENENKELILIRQEKERMIDGSVPVMAVLTDDHNLHIREHRAALADVEIRQDPEVVQRVLDHIQEHFNILSNPEVAQILMSLGQQPIQMAPPPPPMPPNISQQEADAAGALMTNSEAQTLNPAASAENMRNAQMPSPPAPFEGAPMTPEQNMAKISGGGQ